MSPEMYKLPIQDPQVFARCFRRAHFARRVLSDVFRQEVGNISSASVGIFEHERVDGSMGHSAHVANVYMNGISEPGATIIVQKDFTPTAHLTARQVDCIFHPDTTTEPVYIITFVDTLPTCPSTSAVLKYTMTDVVGHKLCDRRWEYFICCRYADSLATPFLRTLCKMLRGELDILNENYTAINDTMWGVAAEIQQEREAEEARYQEALANDGFFSADTSADEEPTSFDDGENTAPELPDTDSVVNAAGTEAAVDSTVSASDSSASVPSPVSGQ